MADNYLERQREAYEARKAAWEKAKKLGKKTLKHQRKEQGKQSLTPGPSPKERGGEGNGYLRTQKLINLKT